jgi:hypothetical protein
MGLKKKIMDKLMLEFREVIMQIKTKEKTLLFSENVTAETNEKLIGVTVFLLLFRLECFNHHKFNIMEHLV